MPVASSIEADAADGNLDKWKGRIIIVDYTRYVNYINQTIAKKDPSANHLPVAEGSFLLKFI